MIMIKGRGGGGGGGDDDDEDDDDDGNDDAYPVDPVSPQARNPTRFSNADKIHAVKSS